MGCMSLLKWFTEKAAYDTYVRSLCVLHRRALYNKQTNKQLAYTYTSHAANSSQPF